MCKFTFVSKEEFEHHNIPIDSMGKITFRCKKCDELFKKKWPHLTPPGILIFVREYLNKYSRGIKYECECGSFIDVTTLEKTYTE